MTAGAGARHEHPEPEPVLLDRRVAPAEAGTRLDVVLAGWLDEPRSRSQARIAAGEVRVDSAAAAKGHRLAAGQRVCVRMPPPTPPAPPPPVVAVRFEDDHLAVVAKPAGLVVHPGAGTRGPTLVDALLAQGMDLAVGADPDRPGIVHRLDRGTSGLLVVAKTPAAHSGLVAGLRRHEVEREYWALCEGVPAAPSATIDAPIARDPRTRTRFTTAPEGRPATTHYDVAAAYGQAAELRVRLETGRTHQVRVHLAAIGHPLCGDAAYGAAPARARALGLDRPALHARRLAFAHPLTGRRIEVREPLPADLEGARTRLAQGEDG